LPHLRVSQRELVSFLSCHPFTYLPFSFLSQEALRKALS
jgi:hypothetical protein